MKESDLYPPLKRLLEAQGYQVKGEVHGCDVLAVRAGEPPVVIELKVSLNLDVVLQAVTRLTLTSKVYLGIPAGCGPFERRRKSVLKLLRMLGLGLVVIDLKSAGAARVVLDPGVYTPRRSKPRQERLLGEFGRRAGDPNLGGSQTRGGIVTAYRQRAVEIALLLQAQGPTKASRVAEALGEPKARDFLYRDYYGWFERASPGVYGLSPRGRQEIVLWEGRAA